MNLPKTVSGRKKRVGRGYGSGKGGHTVGRGSKGQKSRNRVHILFEGVKMKKSLLRRLPLQRGKAKFKAGVKPAIIQLEALNSLKDGAKVDIKSLVKAGIVSEKIAKMQGVKILSGKGEITKKLEINVPVSQKARTLIEKAGGKVLS